MKRVRCAWPARVPIGERDLQRGVGGLRAGVAEEHVVEIAGRERRDPARQLEGARMAELEGRREIERRGLRLDRLHDRVAVVAGVGAPQAGGAVEDRAALRRVVVHVLGARDQPRPRLEGAVGGERHEEGFEVVRDRRGDGGFVCLLAMACLVPERLPLPRMRTERGRVLDYPLSRIMTKGGGIMTGGGGCYVATDSRPVMAGLVPAIHVLLPDQQVRRGCPARGRA